MKVQIIALLLVSIFTNILCQDDDNGDNSAVNVTSLDHPTSSAVGVPYGSPMVQKVTKPFFHNTGFGWSSTRNALIFADFDLVTFNLYYPDTGKTYSTVISELKRENLVSATPVTSENNNKYILTTKRSLYLMTTKGEREEMTYQIEHIMDVPSSQFSFITTTEVDSKMNMVIGTTMMPALFQNQIESTELLHVNIQTKKITVLDEGFEDIKSLCFDNSYKKLYVSDSVENVVFEYDYDADKPSASNPKVVFDMAENTQLPKSKISAIVIDTKNIMYIGFTSFESLAVYDLKKQEIRDLIALVAKPISSLSFGGKEKETLYVGTKKGTANPHSGSVLAVSGTGSNGIQKYKIKI